MADLPPWRPLTDADLPAVAALAARVLATDGGLPLAADPAFLQRRYAGQGVVRRGAGDAAGLVAAGAVRPGPDGAVAVGMVDPRGRGRGVGAALLDWALATAGRPVTVETESLTDGAAALFASRGLARVFAEDVMRYDLADRSPPDVALPPGVGLVPWTADVADRFFAAYEASFRDRAGFPGWPAERWIDWIAGDDEFRPDWSVLAVDDRAGDVGFIACAVGWITQVGVRPDQRGRGLGAALVAEALRRMRAAGEAQALLDVHVDNPAGGLYRRLGFAVIGRRARFAPVGG